MVILAKELYFIMDETDDAHLCLDFPPMISYFKSIGVLKYDLFPFVNGAALVANIQPNYQTLIPTCGFEGYCILKDKITIYDDIVQTMDKEWCRLVMALEWGTFFFPLNHFTEKSGLYRSWKKYKGIL